MPETTSLSTKFVTLWRVAKFRPVFTVGIILLSIVAATLEGIGLGFLIPIIEQARGGGDSGRVVEAFTALYEALSIPFTLEYIIVGVTLVMVLRYVSSFLVAWLRATLRTTYVRQLQTHAFSNALGANVGYFDTQGTDDIMNTIVTESRQGSNVIRQITRIAEQTFLVVMYLAIALYLAPLLTVGTVVILGTILVILRAVVESGYAVGDRVADANERVQRVVQAGTQGIRDVKVFGLSGEIFDEFQQAADQYVTARVTLHRNKSAMQNFYQLFTAVTVFFLIYVVLRFTDLSLASLGVFLFAMFRLAPRVSSLNDMVYQLDGYLPHLIRTHGFINDLQSAQEPDGGSEPVPAPIETVSVENVSFGYEPNERVLQDISFAVERGEFVAFVGASGAGKSTIVSLLLRLYEPDTGSITANGVPITEFPTAAWRDRLSVVRQNPYIFNDTLRYNVTIGERDATEARFRSACELAQVTEFVDALPDGYDTVLGDEGVRLSGGQKQRIAIARALLRDADLLLLDEATSDLDMNIEQDVHAGIETLDRDCAMVVIAHRLSTVQDADRIYTMNDGAIVEVGTHEELIALGERYAALHEPQTRDSV